MTGPKNARSSPLIIAMLIASLLLTGTLAWQAFSAVTTQRQLAEQVLQDYSALIADEFVRRATVQLGYYGYYDLVNQLQAFAGQGGEPPGPDELRNAGGRPDSPAGHSSSLASAIAFYEPASDILRTRGEPNPAEQELMREALGGVDISDDAMQPFGVITVSNDESVASFVVAPVAGEADSIIVFRIDPMALGEWLSPVFDQAPLLPASLVGDEFSNDDLFVSLSDPNGRLLLKTGNRYDPAMLVRRSLGDDYQGVLKNFQLVAGIDPSVAPQLVIGGMPYSRLPVILLLLLMSIAMIVAAIRQLRRERELMQMRSDFVAQVSHELRTPLTQIRMFAETLLFNRIRNDNDRQRALEIINRESQRLAHLVENVLQFSRGERDQISLDIRRQALVPLIEQLVREFDPLSGSCSIGIDCMISRNASVSVDDGALKQVLLNLLDNAIKYGPSEQHVRIALERSGSKVIIAVEDQGPGIPDSDKEKIWGGFYRLPREQNRAIAGTGIGLAVVRELITLQGGRCWAENNSAGGARIVIELPLYQEDRSSRSGAGDAIEPTSVTE